jgi:hypothetical protein
MKRLPFLFSGPRSSDSPLSVPESSVPAGTGREECFLKDDRTLPVDLHLYKWHGTAWRDGSSQWKKGGDVRRFRKAPVVVWTVFLAIFLPGAGGPGDSVICFGEDGHVAVEAAVTPGACHSASLERDAAVDEPERELSREGDHCGPCVDVASLSGPWASTMFSSNLSEHTVSSALSTLPTSRNGNEVPVSAGEGLLALRLDPPAGASCAFLRTTVLLI